MSPVPSTLLPRDVLRPGGRALGTWIKMPTPEPTEIAAHAGFDFVVVDLEHAPLSTETAYRLINLAAANGVVPFVRVPDKEVSTIQKILDAGAHGVFVPHVDTIVEAEAIARAFSFPPDGIRGAGSTSKAGLWGLRSNPEYLEFGRTQAMLVLQLESEESITHAAAMAALPAVAALFVGAADLSMSMGSTPTSPDTLAHIETARAAAHDAGKLFGLAYGGSADAVRDAFDRDTDFVLASNDAGLLAAAAAALVTDIRKS